jgi:hypothetical protein
LLSLGVGLWAIDAWRTDGDATWLMLTVLAFAGGGGLVVYGNRFLQKVRKLGIAVLLVAGSLGLPADVLACTVCIGNSTSPLRSGLGAGILLLLGVTGFMLVCFAAFFVYLARKARSAALEPVKGSALDMPIHEGSM